MNLHVKLSLPAILLAAVIAATIHYYWFPNYLKVEIEDQLSSEKSFAKLLGTTLIPDILSNDFAKIHSTIDDVHENRPFWHTIKLHDAQGLRIYPLTDTQVSEDILLERIEHEVIFDDNVIATLSTLIDIEASSAQRIAHIHDLEMILLTALLIMVILSLLLQDRLIRTPLQSLTDYAKDIAAGKYDSRIEYTSHDEVGELITVFNVMKNEVRQREADLINSETRNKAVIENAVDGIITIDVRGTITTINKATEHIFGFSSAELIGKNVNILMPQPYKREHDGYIYNYLSTGDKKVIGIGREVKGLRKNGESFPLELAVSEISHDNKRTFIGIIRDISERKQIEQMKSEFISTVSHELRTPLTSIRGALSLVLGKGGHELPPKLLRMLETANRNSERLTFLINDLLDLEKINAGKLEFNIEAINLLDLTERAIEENTGYAHSHDVTLKLYAEIDPSTTIRADENRLLQVFANLISNAIKYSPKQDTVAIDITKNDNRARITITDNGPGIPKEFRSRIFGRFAQADSSDTRKKGGTGLGLTITKAIIEHLGGNIGYNSTEGKGASFYFELGTWEQSLEQTIHDVSMPKVLVCEDDNDVAYILSSLLESEGLSVDIAATAQAVRDLTEKNDYHLLLLDLNLPDGNGLDLIRELRESDSTRKLPIIVISARANEGKKEFNGDAVTVADWLQKPIERERLANAVYDALNGNQRAQILHVEDNADIIQITHSLFEDNADYDHANSLATAREKLANNRYDLVLLDITLPDGSGLELLDEINNECPIILFTGQEVAQDINLKVAASLTKSRTSNKELINAVHRLLKPSL